MSSNKHIDEILKLIDEVLKEEELERTQPKDEPVRVVTAISSSSTR